MVARSKPPQRSRTRYRPVIDLGHGAPIEASGSRLGAQDRRHISYRWLASIALTGLGGMALVGSALYLGLGSQSNFAETPQYVEAPQNDQAEGEAVNPGKGDRLVRPVDIVAAKQSFSAQTTLRVGEKDIVKARSFTRVATTLTTTPTGFADAVPPFNPLKLASTPAGQPEPPPDTGPVQDAAEVAFSTHELSATDADLIAGELTAAEAEAQAAELARANVGAKAPLPLPPQMLLMRTSQAGIDPLGALGYANVGAVNPNAPFSSIEVRMVPENVTNVAKSVVVGEEAPRETLVQLRRDESFEDMLRAQGAGKSAIGAILHAFGAKAGAAPPAEGQKIILKFDEPEADASTRAIARISIYADEQLKTAIALSDEGDYVRVQQTAPTPHKAAAGNEDAGGMELYQSLFETALKQGIPKPVVQEMVAAFANDVDFQRPTTAGDAVEAFYSEPDDIDPHPQLLYATITLRDQSLKFYRFQTPDDGVVDYYDENGRSTRKFLIRKPIASGELRSTFGMRFHPILHYLRMHNGVDWSAPIGTPILAAGSGTVIKAEFTSGYGRRVEIQHINGYVTTYNHMSGFGPGMAAGVHVNQGQVVGYLGQSGLSTGPHLHYEVIINGNFVDPMAIKLARTREFDGKLLSSFKHERDRVDALMAQAPNAPLLTAAKTN